MENLKIQILKAIEENSRVDLKLLGEKFNVSEIEVANAIGEMEKGGIICGYHTMINWDNTSEERVTALIEVRVTPQRDDGYNRIAKRILDHEEVTSVYLISGNYDYLVTIDGRTLKEVAHFVNEKLAPIHGVIGIATYFVLKKYKDHGSVFTFNTKDERILVTP